MELLITYYLENPSFPGNITIFTERKIYGETWWKDKSFHRLIGFIEFVDNNWEVVECHEYYDEEEDDTREENILVKIFNNSKDAFEFAKVHFNIKEKR